MACLGLELGAAGWKAQMNPLNSGGTLLLFYYILIFKDIFDSSKRRKSGKDN